MLLSLRYNMSMHEPIFLEEYSQRLSEDQKVLHAMNPAVWDAAVATLRFGAFFRYMKNNHSDSWQQFLSQIRDIKITPHVETPTVLWPVKQNQQE
jgi:hypothetical protein